MSNFLSTKFVFSVLVVAMAYGLVLMGKLDAKAWLDMSVIAAGIYGATNVAQDFAPKQ